MVTHIYLVRHGQVDNPKNIFYGRLPRIKLSQEGRLKLKQTAKFLKKNDIFVNIFSSPLTRSRESSLIIKEENKIENISITKDITEVDSFMEGMPFSFGKEIRFDHYFSSHRKRDNETIEDVANRMMNFIKRVSIKYPKQNIIAVSHGDPIMILQATILGLPLNLDSIRSGKVNYISYGEVFRVSLKDGIPESINSIFIPK